MRVEIKPVTDEAIMLLAMTMRDADRLEFSAMTGKPASVDHLVTELERMVSKSHGLARAGWCDGELAAVWGVSTMTALSPEGNPWMLCTDVAEVAGKAIAQRSRGSLLAAIPPSVRYLWNLVHVENTLAIGWLKRMGFTFRDEPIHHGGIDWLYFSMEG